MATVCSAGCYEDFLRLQNDIASNKNYSITLNPNSGSSNPLTIIGFFAIVKLLALTNGGLINVVGGLTLNWRDPRLSWSPASYNNLTATTIPPYLIWTPQITLVNGVSENLLFSMNNGTIASLYHDGSVFINLAGQFKATCSMNLTYFPFDTQVCVLQFVIIDLRTAHNSCNFVAMPDTGELSTQMYSESGEFTLNYIESNGDTTILHGLNLYYPTMNLTLSLSRNPNYYITNVAIPSLLLLLASGLVFLLPSDNSVKITMGCSVMVALYVLQQNVARMLPATKDTPLLAEGMTIELFLSGFSLACAVLSVALRALQPPLVSFVAKLADACDFVLCLPKIPVRSNQVIPMSVRSTSFSQRAAALRKTASVEPEQEEKFAPVTEAILLLVETLREERLLRSESANQGEAIQLARRWKVLDFLLNSVLFLVYIALAVCLSVQYLFHA